MQASALPYVIDATAGLGSDAFVLATLGCRVLMLERSAIIHALLEDGLERGRDDVAVNRSMDERLTLRRKDAIPFLQTLPVRQRPDVVCLDPMYPDTARSALNRKEMRILREMVGEDEDAPELLAAARRQARRRVVVKRPRLAPPLEGSAPSIQLNGKSTRYDIYLV
jgi:16S rRNA (guanine1516-N2)-methyltransferase